MFGGTDRGRDLIRAIDNDPACDIGIVAVFDDRSNARRPETVGDHPVIGTKTELIDYVRNNPVDMVIVALPMRAEARVLALLKDLWVLPVNIRLTAASEQIRFSSKAYHYIGNVPLLNVFERPISDWDRIVKLVEDRVLAAVLLTLLSPFMLLIGLLVRLDSPGPALFRQKRYGFNNELIEVYKFRTLYQNKSDTNADDARDQERQPRDAARPVPPQDQPRRIAAAHHGAQRRHVDRRPPAPCDPGQGGRPAL